MFDVQVIEESITIIYINLCIFIRELAEWFIAVSLKLTLVNYTNIRSNRIFSDESINYI